MSQAQALPLNFQPIVLEFDDRIKDLLNLLEKQKNMLNRFEFKKLNELREQQTTTLSDLDVIFREISEQKQNFLRHDLERVQELAQLLHNTLQENMNLLSYAKTFQCNKLKIFDRVEKTKTATYDSNCFKQQQFIEPTLRTSF